MENKGLFKKIGYMASVMHTTLAISGAKIDKFIKGFYSHFSMKFGFWNRVVNSGIKTWAGLMTGLQIFNYVRGVGPFVRNDQTEARLTVNFLGKPYYPHLPGIKYYGKWFRFVRPLVGQNGENIEVPLETVPLDSKVHIRKGGLEGDLSFQILYYTPRDHESVEQFGRYLGGDVSRLVEPFNQGVMKAIDSIGNDATLTEISERAKEILVDDKKVAEEYRQKYGVVIKNISLASSIDYDDASQEILSIEKRAISEAREREIMSEGIKIGLTNIINGVAGAYKDKGIEISGERIRQDTMELYKLERYHSMSQNRGSTIIFSQPDNPRLIPPYILGKRKAEEGDGEGEEVEREGV